MTQPFISIITCTKNSEKYLPACLSSIQSQDFLDYEHIIIDGNSKDKTLSIINQFVAKNPRAKLYSSPPRGISNAMNEGAKKANGKYVFILHSDDGFYNSQVLSNVATFLKKNAGVDWVYGQICVVDSQNNKIGIFPRYRIFQFPNYKLLKFFNYIPHQAVFIKKNILSKKSFDENLSSSMDFDLWLRIANNTRWIYMPVLVANYRVHSLAQSSSQDNRKKNQENHQLVKSRYLSGPEQFLGKLIDRVLYRTNKTLR